MTSIPRTGQFQPTPPGIGNYITSASVLDVINVPYCVAPNPSATWSNGATSTVPNMLQGPDTDQDWSILSVTVQAYLSVFMQPGLRFAGKLGKIEAGLIMPPASGDVGTLVSASGLVNYPSDQTLVTTLWDSETGDMPPGIAASSGSPSQGQGLPISCTILPPNPIKLTSGYTPGIGIWMHETLLTVANDASGFAVPSFFSLGVCYASWTINYEDGR